MSISDSAQQQFHNIDLMVCPARIQKRYPLLSTKNLSPVTGTLAIEIFLRTSRERDSSTRVFPALGNRTGNVRSSKMKDTNFPNLPLAYELRGRRRQGTFLQFLASDSTPPHR